MPARPTRILVKGTSGGRGNGTDLYLLAIGQVDGRLQYHLVAILDPRVYLGVGAVIGRDRDVTQD